MKARDIIKAIEEFAPLSIQEGWDNSGLCVGSPEDEVSSVLLGLDCTEKLIDEAIECGADMIVTHHPLIFSGLKKISPEDQTGAAVIKAIKAGICIYAAHTNADKVIAEPGHFSHYTGSDALEKNFWGFRELIITPQTAITRYITVQTKLVFGGTLFIDLKRTTQNAARLY